MNFWLTILIIIVTYIGIAIGSLPYLRTIALIGIGLLLALRLLSFDDISPLLEINYLTDGIFASLTPIFSKSVIGLSVITAVLSNLVSNVTAVLLLRPAVTALPNPIAGWLTLAVSSTLAGNFTLLGSVAEIAAKRGVKLTFWEYTKSGIIITLISLTIGIFWIQIFIWK